MRQLNQGSFVSAVCSVVCFLVIYIEFFPNCLFVSNSQVIGCEDCLRNDILCRVGRYTLLNPIQSVNCYNIVLFCLHVILEC